MCSSPSTDVLYFILCVSTHNEQPPSSGKSGECKVVWGAKAKMRIKKRMERITSRNSVSVCAKKSTQTVRHTQNSYRFSIWTGTRELNIMCASLLYNGSLCVHCIWTAHNECEMIFCLSASHTRQKALPFVVPFSKCKCLLFVVTTDWVIWECIGETTGLKNDWQHEKRSIAYVKICGEQAAMESQCSDIKREKC